MSASGIAARPALRLDDRLRNLIVLAVTAAPTVGQLPPDFKTTTVDGTPVSLSQYAGQPVWLMFAASWCPDCRSEAPDVEATYEKYEDQGLVVLSVNIEEDADAVKAYAARAGLTYPAVADPSTTIASRYRV